MGRIHDDGNYQLLHFCGSFTTGCSGLNCPFGILKDWPICIYAAFSSENPLAACNYSFTVIDWHHLLISLCAKSLLGIFKYNYCYWQHNRFIVQRLNPFGESLFRHLYILYDSMDPIYENKLLLAYSTHRQKSCLFCQTGCQSANSQ